MTNTFERDLGVIRINEGKEYGFNFGIVFDSEEEAEYILHKFPKSYRVYLAHTSYPLLNIRKPYLRVSISFVPNKVTGKVNEAGRIRAEKIKSKLRELLPHYRVITTIYVPVPGYKHQFKQLTEYEGWR